MRLTRRFIFEFLKKKPDKVSSTKVEQIIQAVEKPLEPPSKVDQLKYQFTPFQLYITQGKGIQRPYSGEHYWRSPGTVGNYHCVVCGSHLFTNFHKFPADTGICGFWGSEQDAVQVQPDKEVNCKKCSSHLGYSIDNELHPPTWIHYSVKDGAINFTPKPDFELPPPRNWAKKEKREVKKKQKEEKEKLQQEQQREESRQKKLAKKQEKELQEKKEEQKQEQQDQKIYNKEQFQGQIYLYILLYLSLFQSLFNMNGLYRGNYSNAYI